MRSSPWAPHLSNVHRQGRSFHPQSRSSSSTASANGRSSSDDLNPRVAMSKGDLESCQWLKPSDKTFGSESSAYRSPSPALSASFECCFSASSSGSVQSSNGVPAQPSSSHSSDGSAHAASLKHSNVLLNAFTASRLLDAAFGPSWIERAENAIERAIFDFRFLSLLAVAGSLAGSFLCFLKGCVFIVESYQAFYVMCLRGEHTGKMVLRLVEAVDVYLTGTVMLIFGMGLYGLFISNVASNLPPNQDRALQNSSLFGMFLLQERPKWMRIASLDELKTKLGHVVVMILLVKMFERSKAVVIATGADLLSYSVSIFLTSGALLVLRHLHH
ncbi:hypothetical protein GOP47_0020933 [Adiantum capillus-veneris]|uniref:Uncharacterized protein n=1 Tax=Adiantum capillus-veneris TaxID=13818 RepID=A0A9D4UB24_ADICA|nr:hypothetical protein GOP47_0020933 [Adiantum capillus-veneris]